MVFEKKYAPQGVPDKLEIYQAVVVPSTNSAQQFIGDEAFNRRVKDTQAFLIRTFGGYTQVRGQGGWQGDVGQVDEQVAKVESFAKDTINFKAKQKKLVDWLRKKKKEWGQEALSYVVETDIYFV